MQAPNSQPKPSASTGSPWRPTCGSSLPSRCWGPSFAASLASDDWAAEGIVNDVKPGGAFKSRNFAKDGSFEFIFGGTYDTVDPRKRVTYTLGDGRKVEVMFDETPDGVRMSKLFEPEAQNPEKQQQEGWQAYLDNFKKYVESSR